MKEQKIYIQAIKREIIYYIGENKDDNFNVIDKGLPYDLWFHAANGESSCHIVCNVPENLEKKDLRYLISTGAVLCKRFTNKLKNKKNVSIEYTQIKNITKTNIPGSVIALDIKTKII